MCVHYEGKEVSFQPINFKWTHFEVHLFEYRILYDI